MYEDEIARFKAVHGYELNLINPKTYSEKVVCKKLFDRNPLLVTTSDKYRARGYIADKLGTDKYLVPLLWHGKRPEAIPFDQLGKSYIIKPNNGSGRFILCNGGQYIINKIKFSHIPSPHRLIQEIHKWFDSVHGSEWYEWAYTQIEPLIVIEKLLTDKGKILKDYKFFMFGDKCGVALACTDRMGRAINTYYDEDWNVLDVNMDSTKLPEKCVEDKPATYGLMLEIAKKLSADFDAVRVDLYSDGSRVYCGELTHYPSSGLQKLVPLEFDYELGSYWKLGDYC